MANIDLARCEDFQIGSLIIRPSSREIAKGPACETIEPKVMQLLVALSMADGRVVSRDELIDRCWHGRVVSEDAINRVVAKLRRLTEGTAQGDFRVETVARVGYRLAPIDPTRPSNFNGAAVQAQKVVDVAPPLRGERFQSKPALFGVIGVGMVAIAALAAFLGHAPSLQKVRPNDTGYATAYNDLETRGLSAMFENTPEQTAEGQVYLRQASDLAPKSAPIWGALAMNYVLSLGWAPTGERSAIAARAKDAAAHALAIDPHESRSQAAIFSLLPTFGNWDHKEDELRAAEARATPDDGPLQYQKIQFLMDVGRTREALAIADQLVKVSPLIPWIQAARINLLAASGRLNDADQAAEKAYAIWPRDRLIWFTRFDLSAFNGRTDRALAMAADRNSWPKRTDGEEVLLAARVAEALASHESEDVDALMRDYGRSLNSGQGHTERAMRAAAALGRSKDALVFAQHLFRDPIPVEPHGTILLRVGNPQNSERPTAALFLPPMQRVWKEKAFQLLLEEIGLQKYWAKSKHPDLART